MENITVVRANELQGQTGAIDPCHVAAILDLKQAWTGCIMINKIAKMPQFTLSALFKPLHPGFKSKMAAA